MKAYVRPLSITIGVASTLSAALAWTFVACTNPVATAVPLNLFAQSYAQALCGSLDHCCTQNSITFSNDTCTAGWRSLVQAAIDDPTTGYAANYDPNLASTCLSMVRAEAATACVPVDTTQTDARTACEAVFAGKKAPGSPCGASAECAPQAMSTTTCANVAGAVPSAGSTLPLDEPVCVATMATAPMMGDACTPVTSGTDPCDPMAMGMLHCDTTMMSTCQPYVAAESPCAATTESIRKPARRRLRAHRSSGRGTLVRKAMNATARACAPEEHASQRARPALHARATQRARAARATRCSTSASPTRSRPACPALASAIDLSRRVQNQLCAFCT
jgi:hypothetical protein